MEFFFHQLFYRACGRGLWAIATTLIRCIAIVVLIGIVSQPRVSIAGIDMCEADPVDVQLFIQVNGLAQQLSGGPGQETRSILSEMGLFARTAASWKSLSTSLGLSSEDAIARLLAGRFTLLADGIDGAQPTWACVMSIDPKVGSRIPKALKAAPRGTLKGRTVYSIEDGKLMVMPIGHDGRVLAVAAKGASRMLHACVEIAADWRATENEGINPSAVIMYRPDERSWMSGTVQPAAQGWDFEFSAMGGVLGIPAGDARPSMPGVDGNWFGELSSGASIAYAGPVGPSGLGHLSEGKHGVTGWKLTDIPRLASVFLPYTPPVAFMEGEADFGAFVNHGGGRGSMWFRVPNAARAAKLGDTHVCDLLGNLSGADLVSGDSPECTGQFPSASRRLAVKTMYGPRERIGLTWGTQRYAAVTKSAGMMPDTVSNTWWRLRSEAEPVGIAADSGAPVLDHRANAAFLRFAVRPNLLVRQMNARGDGTQASGVAASGLESVNPLLSISRVRLIDCALRRNEVGGTTGQLRLRFEDGE